MKKYNPEAHHDALMASVAVSARIRRDALKKWIVRQKCAAQDAAGHQTNTRRFRSASAFDQSNVAIIAAEPHTGLPAARHTALFALDE
jgi:hypothetical protein